LSQRRNNVVPRTDIIGSQHADSRGTTLPLLWPRLIEMRGGHSSLRNRGAWIPVLFDAKARKRPKAEGLRINERLEELGVGFYTTHADIGSTVEETATRLSTGRLRVLPVRHIDEHARHRRLAAGQEMSIGRDCRKRWLFPVPRGPSSTKL